MRMNLLPHNQTSYEKVMKAFETADRTCIIHPTGTGKSYIIAAVSEQFERVLVLAPNIYVLSQVQSVTDWHKGMDYMTYAYLNSRGLDKHYDLIVLDEFHRTGANEWGKAVDEALEYNGGKVLGTTATPIRYLDDGRNMADEIFNGNIASSITLGEAWSRNILPIPTYVTGLFDFQQTADEVRERISNARNISDKADRLEKLAKVELDWQTSNGMASVLRRHITNDMHRLIVFCGHIKHLETMTNTIREWFSEADIQVADIYRLHSDMTDSEQADAMKGFQQDNGDGVKIILAVNMLNEGVHVPRVDAVIMLRTTASRIIYMQQLGRCLTAANSERPVVLDMVDNISSANVIKYIKDDFDKAEREQYEQSGDHEKVLRTFTITDYTQDIRKVVDKLKEGTYHFIPFADRLARVEAYCQEHGYLPIEKHRDEYRNWLIVMQYRDTEPRVSELESLYPRFDTDQRVREIITFCQHEHRLPNGSIRKEKSLWTFLNRHKEQLMKDYPELKAEHDKYYKRLTSAERYEIVKAFYEQKGRRPIRKDGDPFKHERYLVRKCGDEWHDKILESIKELKPKPKPKPAPKQPRTIEECVEEVEAFCQQHGRLPQPKDGKAGSAWGRLRIVHHPIHEALTNKYRANKRWEDRLDELEAFVKANGQMPSRRKHHALANYWAMVRAKHSDDPRVIRIRQMSKYDLKGQPVE